MVAGLSPHNVQLKKFIRKTVKYQRCANEDDCESYKGGGARESTERQIWLVGNHICYSSMIFTWKCNIYETRAGHIVIKYLSIYFNNLYTRIFKCVSFLVFSIICNCYEVTKNDFFYLNFFTSWYCNITMCNGLATVLFEYFIEFKVRFYIYR